MATLMNGTVLENFNWWMDEDRDAAIEKLEGKGKTAGEVLEEWDDVWMNYQAHSYFRKNYSLNASETYALIGDLDGWIESNEDY